MFELVQVQEPVVKGSNAFVDFCIISLTLQREQRVGRILMLWLIRYVHVVQTDIMADTDADVFHEVVTDISVLLDKEGFLADQPATKVDKLRNETATISIAMIAMKMCHRHHHQCHYH